jgi:hypothetical protein
VYDAQLAVVASELKSAAARRGRANLNALSSSPSRSHLALAFVLYIFPCIHCRTIMEALFFNVRHVSRHVLFELLITVTSGQLGFPGRHRTRLQGRHPHVGPVRQPLPM